jgi:hypothetical protein
MMERAEDLTHAMQYHSCAVTSEGGVKCWGLGKTGQVIRNVVLFLENVCLLYQGISFLSRMTLFSAARRRLNGQFNELLLIFRRASLQSFDSIFCCWIEQRRCIHFSKRGTLIPRGMHAYLNRVYYRDVVDFIVFML